MISTSRIEARSDNVETKSMRLALDHLHLGLLKMEEKESRMHPKILILVNGLGRKQGEYRRRQGINASASSL